MVNKVLLIDNYDSFTYNLVLVLKQVTNDNVDIVVKYNDYITLQEVEYFSNIIISPGPGLVKDAGISKEIIKNFYRTKKILGVCLGHQAIVESFGGSLRNLETVKHGESSQLKILKPENKLFFQIEQNSQIGHYHSWVADEKKFPQQSLEILATNTDNLIMAVKHRLYPSYGIQFHPESILTRQGHQFLLNWLRL